MYPFFRLFCTIQRARKRSKLANNEPSQIEFYCHPWDLDLFNEMNNGRIATLYDLGRMDLGVRTGLLEALRRYRWSLVVAGSSIRYRKRIHAFDKITMHSRFLGFDDRWMYIEQSMWVKGSPCSSILIRGGITDPNGLVTPDKIKAAFPENHVPEQLPTWVHEWIDSEQHRPWPPNQTELADSQVSPNHI